MAEGRLVSGLRNDYLTCSICVETFNDPKSLDCGHSFCFKCLEEYFRSTPEVRDAMVCPICRQKTNLRMHKDPKDVIDSLPTDKVLLSVLKAVGPHLKSNIESENHVDYITDSIAFTNVKKMDCMCERHVDKSLDVYCAKHDLVICSECAWREHKGEECKCMPIEDVINKRFGALKCLVAQQIADASHLFESKDPAAETLDSLHDNFQRAVVDLEEKFACLCKAFTERIKCLKQNAIETIEKDSSAKAIKALQVDLIEQIKFFENDGQCDNPNRTLKDISEMCATSSRFQVHIRDLSDKVKTGGLLWNSEKDLSAMDRFMTIAKEALPDQFIPFSEAMKDDGDDSEYVMVTNSGQFADSKESVEDSIDSFQQYTFTAKQKGEQVCNLSSIALLGTTSLVVVDQVNRKVKKFKIPEGKFLSEIQLEFDPYQVATIPESSHVVVTVWEAPKLLVLASDPVLEILRVVDTDTEYIGVASNIAGVLAVSSIRHSRVDILKLNQSNFEITGRETVSQTSRIRNFPDRLAVTRNRSIIVRNKRRNEVKCVDREHKVIWSRRFKSPVADVTSFRGKVFVSLVKKNEIFCFHENGIEDVRSFKPGREVSNPWSMDGFKDCLVVTEDSPSAVVHVFVFACGT